VRLLVAVYFFWLTGFYGFSLWLPNVIKTMTGDGSATTVGLLTAIPYACALVAMLLNASWSDRTGNRRLAVAVPPLIAAAALIVGTTLHDVVWQMVLLCVVAAAVYAPYGAFWAMPAQILRFEVIAVAMGVINAIGNLGGFAGPYLVGWLGDRTGSSSAGFIVLAVSLVISSMITAVLLKPADRRVEVGA
jgi:nitrate/nitrite transporter NarK